jgi:hypothetical protein
VVVKAWRSDRLVYEDHMRVSTAGPTCFDADYRSVTRVEFSSEARWQIVIDDLEFRKD